MAAAKWTFGGTTVGVDPATGLLTVTATVSDNNVKQADITITLTADRRLKVLWHPAPGALPLSGFEAWQG